MIDQLKSKLKELELSKSALKPQIDEINAKREEEIQKINKKYDHMIYEANYEIKIFEDGIFNEIINSFINVVSQELDIKRSNSLYTVSEGLKEFKETMKKLDIFPEELLGKLHKVINGDPIENIIYELEDIKKKYLRT
ncbi:MAG: hypothetical protein ACXABO_05825 [Promethearchaeota archaeon]|jgi:hypothetical protein